MKPFEVFRDDAYRRKIEEMELLAKFIEIEKSFKGPNAV